MYELTEAVLLLERVECHHIRHLDHDLSQPQLYRPEGYTVIII
jgi:hypothetical protein